jgi:cytochrome b561
LETPKRYHPLLVTLHWLVGILVLLNLFIGKFVFPDQDYPELAAAVHMAAGISVLALIIVRFFVRLRFPRPAEATSGHKLTDLLAKVVRYGLYIMLATITTIGVTFATQSGRLARTFMGAGPASGPPPESVFLLRDLHGLSANILLLLILMHVAAALYHQFIRKDNLIARMWYGPR